MRKILGLALIFFIGVLPALHAAELEPQGTRMRKFQRGAANIALSPIEIFYTLTRHHTENTFPPAWLFGLAHGLLLAGERVVVGSYEVLTFPFALPRGYKPILLPEFEWEYFV